jgi:hypothetical protein
VEACDIMDLLYHMVSSNKDLCSALLHPDKSLAVKRSKSLVQTEEYMRIDVVKVLCSSIFKYVQHGNNASIMSKTLRLLTEALKCVPYRVFDVALECGFFSSQLNGPSSDWLLSGALARMLFAASEENGDCSSLTVSCMYFCLQAQHLILWNVPFLPVYTYHGWLIVDSVLVFHFCYLNRYICLFSISRTIGRNDLWTYLTNLTMTWSLSITIYT